MRGEEREGGRRGRDRNHYAHSYPTTHPKRMAKPMTEGRQVGTDRRMMRRTSSIQACTNTHVVHVSMHTHRHVTFQPPSLLPPSRHLPPTATCPPAQPPCVCSLTASTFMSRSISSRLMVRWRHRHPKFGPAGGRKKDQLQLK